MAKTYRFRLNAQKAEFSEHFTTVVYGGPETRYGEDFFVGTLEDALGALAHFASRQTRPCVCFLKCMDSPVPRGYKQAQTWVNVRP